MWLLDWIRISYYFYLWNIDSNFAGVAGLSGATSVAVAGAGAAVGWVASFFGWKSLTIYVYCMCVKINVCANTSIKHGCCVK